jgi:dethiobiotin synthetase
VSLFVTGTDTGVGKTKFTVWLLERLRAHGVRCAGYKPICCGDRDDAVQLQTASSPGLTIDEVNPVWLRTPAAPLTAAQTEGRKVDLPALGEGFVRLSERFDFVAIEGVGGWMVPITTDYFSNDLAADLRLPVIVIAENRLGCLNHILLTVSAIRSAGLNCGGIVLNDLAKTADLVMSTNAAILRSCLTLPIHAGFDPGETGIDPWLREMIPEFEEIV